MRVLQINNVYAKLSTGKITRDVHVELIKSGIESYVCYGRGKHIHEEYIYKIGNDFYSKFNKIGALLKGELYGGCFFSTKQLIHLIKKLSPDVVHLQCINDYFVNIYSLLAYLKKENIPTVVTLHAEFFHTGSCGNAYECDQWKTGCEKCPQKDAMHLFVDHTGQAWKKMQRAFSGFQKNRLHVTTVSPWLKNRAVQSPFLSQYPISVVMNGLDDQIFYYREETEKTKPAEFGEKNVLFVTSGLDSPSKGGAFLIELAKKMKDINFIVLGMPSDKTDLPSNIKQLGRIYDQNKMAELYSAADLTVLLSKAETFSMPTAESLCCGTSVVGFQAGGPESIALAEHCNFVEYGNIDKLQEVIADEINKKRDKAAISREAIGRYSKKTMVNAYIEVYKSVVVESDSHE